MCTSLAVRENAAFRVVRPGACFPFTAESLCCVIDRFDHLSLRGLRVRRRIHTWNRSCTGRILDAAREDRRQRSGHEDRGDRTVPFAPRCSAGHSLSASPGKQSERACTV